jgi:hypothetical protein
MEENDIFLSVTSLFWIKFSFRQLLFRRRDSCWRESQNERRRFKVTIILACPPAKAVSLNSHTKSEHRIVAGEIPVKFQSAQQVVSIHGGVFCYLMRGFSQR